MQRSVWRHFLILVLMLGAFMAFSMVAGDPRLRKDDPYTMSQILLGVLIRLPSTLSFAVPLAAGISLAVLDIRVGAIRTAAGIVTFSVALMCVYDIWGYPAANRLQARLREQVWPFASGYAEPLPFGRARGSLERTVIIASGRLTMPDIVPGYKPKEGAPAQQIAADERSIMHYEISSALRDLARLPLAFITAGIVLGFLSWLAQRARFLTRTDGRVFRIVATWVLVYFSQIALFRLLGRAGEYLVDRPVVLMLVPLVPALVIATLGWRSAARAARALA